VITKEDTVLLCISM